MNATATLTKREWQITEFFAWGAAKKEVADRLCISERTVENHARSIFGKTGCNKVNELSAWWFCVKFDISFDLSPLKRAVTAVAMMCLVFVSELCMQTEFARFNRARRRINYEIIFDNQLNKH